MYLVTGEPMNTKILPNRSWHFPTLVAILIITPACILLNFSRPEVQNHPTPVITLDAGGFDTAPCNPENGDGNCDPQSELGSLGCDQIRTPGDLLGGLQPFYPMRLCLTGKPGATPPAQFVYKEGCLLAKFVRYVIYKDGQYRLIQSVADLQETYAPIQTEKEALSYALAATGLGVRYGLQAERGLRYYVDDLQDTFVRQTEQGYLARLYDYKLCGCGPHPTYAVDILITTDGQLEEISRVKVYEDPEEDNLCVD